MEAKPPSAYATSCHEPTAQLLPVARKTRVRSSTAPAPKAPCLKQGICSSGVEASIQAADAQVGLERGASMGNAGTGADALAATAAAERVGVERVVRGILQYSQDFRDRFVKRTRFRERKEEVTSLRYKIPRHFDIIYGSIICVKFESMDWIAILPIHHLKHDLCIVSSRSSTTRRMHI